jgi:hypothetical protein
MDDCQFYLGAVEAGVDLTDSRQLNAYIEGAAGAPANENAAPAGMPAAAGAETMDPAAMMMPPDAAPMPAAM